MFKVHNSNHFFEYVSLYLGNIVFFTFELNIWFRITTITIEVIQIVKFMETLSDWSNVNLQFGFVICCDKV